MAADSGQVLTRDSLNRALLDRQMLLARASVSLPDALEQMGGLQAQYAPSMYIGLWTRVAGFSRDDLTAALERREVIQATLLRSTIHLVSRRDFWPLAMATREARRESWLRGYRKHVSERDAADAARRLRERLRETGTIRRKELDDLVGKPLASGVGLWIDLVRVPPSGTWERRRADLYAAAEDWIGPPDATVEDGCELLVRRYLGGFGPAPPADIANWAGLKTADLDPELQRLPLRRLRAEDGTKLLDLPDATLPDSRTPTPVRFLPTWDAVLLVHARRTGVLPEEHRPRIFHTKMPHSVGTFLVDGQVAGTWRYADGRIATEPFGVLDRRVRRELDEEADRLAAFHA